jgi:hypothetical protein
MRPNAPDHFFASQMTRAPDGLPTRIYPPSGGFFHGAIAMEATTAVCRQCNKRFLLSRRSNQHRRASGSPHQATRFCGPACKQAAWRKRNAERSKSTEGTNTHATVTRVSQRIEKTQEIRAEKTILGIEIYSRYGWEDRVSSGGVPIKVAQLRQSVLVRR